MHIKGDQSVSERHGVIAWTADGWTLSDSGSSNGTRVNGERLEPNGGSAQCTHVDSRSEQGACQVPIMWTTGILAEGRCCRQAEPAATREAWWRGRAEG